MQNSPQLTSSLTTGAVHCPTGHYQGGTSTNGTCTKFSYPKLENNVFWQNSAYNIGVGALSAAYQQHIVTLYNAFTTTPAPTQPQADATAAHGSGVTITGGTGACVARSYWDIGVRGDTGPTNHGSGVTLSASDSVLSAGGSSILGSGNSTGDPHFISEYCNGARTPPEFGASGWAVPPGISDATVPNPIFNLSPGAIVDEGNNWINMSWGPLSLSNPVTATATTSTPLGNYGPADAASSVAPPSIVIAGANFNDAPPFDFYNTPRKPGVVDAGAVQLVSGGGGGGMRASLAPATWTVAQTRNCPGVGILGILACAIDPIQAFTLTNTGSVPLTGVGAGVLGGTATNVANSAIIGLFSNCGNATHTTLAPGATCMVVVQFKPLTAQPAGLKAATISVPTGAGTQTSTLNGTAN
jgi:hypothetical protein